MYHNPLLAGRQTWIVILLARRRKHASALTLDTRTSRRTYSQDGETGAYAAETTRSWQRHKHPHQPEPGSIWRVWKFSLVHNGFSTLADIDIIHLVTTVCTEFRNRSFPHLVRRQPDYTPYIRQSLWTLLDCPQELQNSPNGHDVPFARDAANAFSSGDDERLIPGRVLKAGPVFCTSSH